MSSGDGLGLFGTLGVVFVVFKLVGVIGWSWWLVLLPFYGPVVLVIAFFLFCLFMAWLTGQLD